MEVNEKIPTSDLVAIIFFIVLQVGACLIVFWGVIPSILLLIGYFSARNNKNIKILMTVITACKAYAYLTLFIMFFLSYDSYIKSGFFENALTPLFSGLAICIPYVIAITYYFKNPIEKNSVWIIENGLFHIKKKSDELRIVGRENFTSYSVAHELLKWKELRDQGLISEEEFIKMKEKIMGNNS